MRKLYPTAEALHGEGLIFAARKQESWATPACRGATQLPQIK